MAIGVDVFGIVAGRPNCKIKGSAKVNRTEKKICHDFWAGIERDRMFQAAVSICAVMMDVEEGSEARENGRSQRRNFERKSTTYRAETVWTYHSQVPSA